MTAANAIMRATPPLDDACNPYGSLLHSASTIRSQCHMHSGNRENRSPIVVRHVLAVSPLGAVNVHLR